MWHFTILSLSLHHLCARVVLSALCQPISLNIGDWREAKGKVQICTLNTLNSFQLIAICETSENKLLFKPYWIQSPLNGEIVRNQANQTSFFRFIFHMFHHRTRKKYVMFNNWYWRKKRLFWPMQNHFVVKSFRVEKRKPLFFSDQKFVIFFLVGISLPPFRSSFTCSWHTFLLLLPRRSIALEINHF